MAKKSSATRHTSAARRPQTATKLPGATLVRAGENAENAVSVTTTTTSSATSAASKARTATVATPTRTPATTSTRTETKPTTTAATKATRPATTTRPATAVPSAATRTPSQREQANQLARARATQRARSANLIVPESYKYVLGDLRLTGILAALMFIVIVVLHFVLGG